MKTYQIYLDEEPRGIILAMSHADALTRTIEACGRDYERATFSEVENEYFADTGAWCQIERLQHGWYGVRLYDSEGNLIDKVRCDTLDGAIENFADYKRRADEQ